MLYTLRPTPYATVAVKALGYIGYGRAYFKEFSLGDKVGLAGGFGCYGIPPNNTGGPGELPEIF